MIPLQNFFNSQEYTDVKEYFLSHIRDRAIDIALKGEDTKGIKEANLIIENAFAQLQKEFGNKEATKATNVSE